MNARPQLLGIIERKDGMICLRTERNLWFPLGGSSAIAEEFRESFNEPQESDLGKRLFRYHGSITMENDAQKVAREGKEKADWFFIPDEPRECDK